MIKWPKFQRKTGDNFAEVMAEIDRGKQKNQEILYDMRQKQERFHREMEQKRSFYDMCSTLMKMHQHNLEHEDWAAWYMEENGACLPVALGPFIKKEWMSYINVKNPLSKAEIKYVK